VRTKSPQQAEKILEAASRLFGTQRFHEVRMEDIAAEAEVGKGTLYRYFKDKEELYLALLARASQQFMQRIEEVVQGTGSPRQRLEAVVHSIIASFDEQPHLLDLVQRAEVMRGSEGTADPWQETRQKLPRLVIQLFREGEACGQFSVREPELTVLMLLGGIRSVIKFGEKPRPCGLARRVVENFLRGADPDNERLPSPTESTWSKA
jgi:AcrR family transcriptional regulator